MMWLLCAGLAWASWPELSAPLAGQPHSKDAAIVVAIEDYTHVGDIPGARQNALDWYAWLTQGRGIPADRARLLLDGQATREEIEAAIASLSAEGGETLWFVFVGHGAPSADGQDGLLLDVDVRQTALSVASRGIPQSSLMAQLESGTFSQRVAVLDACFSGRGSDGATLVEGLQPLIPSYSAPTAQTTVLSAGRSDEFAGPLPGLERPAFSYLTLGALRGWGDGNGDGSVSASETAVYTQRALQSVLTGRSQTPQHSGPDVPLSSGGEAGPDLAQIRLALAQAPAQPSQPAPAPEPLPQQPVAGQSARFQPAPGSAMVMVHACLTGPTTLVGTQTALTQALLSWKVGDGKSRSGSNTGLGFNAPPGSTEVSVRGVGFNDQLMLQTQAGGVYYVELVMDYNLLGSLKSAHLMVVDSVYGETGFNRCAKVKQVQ